MTQKATAIVKRSGRLTKPTRDAAQVAAAVEVYRNEGANVLVDSSLLEEVPPDHRLVIRELQFDADRDFYPTRATRNPKKSKYAPSKRALEQIAAALGLQWRPDLCERLDDGKGNRAAFKAVAIAPDTATGQPRMYEATYELDLRDGSALHEEYLEELGEAKRKAKRSRDDQWKVDKKKKAWRMRRRHVVALADTGARLRVIRQVAPVRNDYTYEEIRQPFVTVGVVYTPGIDDPETRRMVAREAARARMAMYWGGGLPAAETSTTPAPAALTHGDEAAEAFRQLEADNPAEFDDDTAEPDDEDLDTPEAAAVEANAGETTADELDTARQQQDEPALTRTQRADGSYGGGYTPTAPTPNVPRGAIVWTDDEGRVERFPDPGVLDGADRRTRVFVVEQAIEQSGYDYAGAMESAGKGGTPPARLPDAWLRKLYSACVEALDDADTVFDDEVIDAEFEPHDWSDDEIPFE